MHFGNNKVKKKYIFTHCLFHPPLPQFYDHATLVLACVSHFPHLPPPSEVGLPQPNEFLKFKKVAIENWKKKDVTQRPGEEHRKNLPRRR